jgi:hypothetical protein
MVVEFAERSPIATAIAVPPILLIDWWGGRMMMPSNSGFVPPRENSRRRAVGISIPAVSAAATVAFAVSPLQV